MTKPQDIITFGKFKGKAVEQDVREAKDVLLDAYCEWYARYN